MRGYKDSRSAIQWPLSGNIRTWGGLQTSVLHEGLYNRLYIWVLFNGHWSLNGTRGSWGGLQCHFRGYTGSRSAIQLGGSTPKNPNPKWDFKLFLGFLGFLGFFRKRCGKYLSQHS